MQHWSAGLLPAPLNSAPGMKQLERAVNAFPVEEFDVRRFGVHRDGRQDDTAAIQRAMDAAADAGVHAVYCPPGDYLIDADKLTVPSGVTLYAHPTMGEYDGGTYAHGARFIRSSAGTASEPIVQLSTSSSCLGIELRWQKTGGALQGVLRMGQSGNFITYAQFKGAIRGTRTGDIAGVTTCYGILFPETADAKYFNTIDAYVTECDVSLKMGNNANANRIVLMSREAHLHCDLNAATGACIENDITVHMFAITILSPAWGLRQHNTNRNTIRGTYEAYGSCFTTDDGTSADDVHIITNEVTPSYVPLTSADLRTQRPVNTSKRTQILIPTSTAGTRNIFGRGNRMQFVEPITGTLPQINRPAGTLAAGDASCKKIITFGSLSTKAGLLSMACRLTVFAYSPSNRGMHVVDVDFTYRNVNASTTAGQLCVTRVANKGNVSPEVTGLWFVSGVTGTPRPFAIALVGGNNAATPFEAVTVELDVLGVTYSTNTIDMQGLASEMSFATAAVTASDVTDGISLLAVADTAV